MNLKNETIKQLFWGAKLVQTLDIMGLCGLNVQVS